MATIMRARSSAFDIAYEESGDGTAVILLRDLHMTTGGCSDL